MLKSQRTHIFFSPHFDDVVISCGGVIECLVNANQQVQIVTVFGARPNMSIRSAYARHLYADWNLNIGADQRADEDQRALNVLGINAGQRWEFDEAPFRQNSAGDPLYASYEELTGMPGSDDQRLIQVITARICREYPLATKTLRFYFPMSIGGHIDHRLLLKVGLNLRALRYSVWFYEDWPYVRHYEYRATAGWHRSFINVNLDRKIAATLQYQSQLKVMGGSTQTVTTRLQTDSRHGTRADFSECLWCVSPKMAGALEMELAPQLPFVEKRDAPSARDFKAFLDTFHFNRIEEVLPVGGGIALDAGSGTGRLSNTIKGKGYHWLGVDLDLTVSRQSDERPAVQTNCQFLPFRSGTMAAVVSWGVIEYVSSPEQVIAEAARVLEAGGIFCGYISFLQPTQGATRYGISPLLMAELLQKYDFKDIVIRPGLNGFAILLWTWLRRWGGAGLGRLAIPLTAAWMVSLAALRFYISWANYRFGRGTGYGMRWVTESAPAEFAGYVLFMARKPARARSHST